MALYLITGVAGFIGSSLARALLERGDDVRGVDDLSTGRRENIAAIESRMDFLIQKSLEPFAPAKGARASGK